MYVVRNKLNGKRASSMSTISKGKRTVNAFHVFTSRSYAREMANRLNDQEMHRIWQIVCVDLVEVENRG